MRGGENDYTKSQISIRGSIHGARSVTFCEKANFMVCFQEASVAETSRGDFLSLSLCLALSPHFLFCHSSFPRHRRTYGRTCHSQARGGCRATQAYARCNLYFAECGECLRVNFLRGLASKSWKERCCWRSFSAWGPRCFAPPPLYILPRRASFLSPSCTPSLLKLAPLPLDHIYPRGCCLGVIS